MADDLSLLFRLRADNAQAKSTIADTRAAIAGLRTSFGSELSQMQNASSKAFSSIQGSLNNFVQNIPGGNVFVNIASGLRSLSTESAAASEGLSSTTAAATGMGAEIAALAGPIGIAVIAIGALIGAQVVAVEKFYELAKSSAEWKGRLFDTSQQLGISTETLSAFEILAATTGGDLGSITAALGIFQKNLEDAHDPTSKQAKLLQELGVQATTTEGALRQTLAQLAAMPEGFHQTALALELFGRGGKSILAILKEMHGDLDGAISRFRQMGLVVSEEDAKAAKEFNVQLDLIQFQLRAASAEIAKDSMPAILEVLKQFSSFLKDNKDTLNDLGEGIQFFISGSLLRLKLELSAVNTVWQEAKNILSPVAELYERIAAATSSIQPVNLAPTGGVGAENFQPANAGGGETNISEHQALTLREKENAEAARKAEEDARRTAKQAAEERERTLQSQLDRKSTRLNSSHR